ncbi:MAG: efflux RND transporter periplasmic adaptor subunit [Paramuribaculum sp.]|nr:efflux RND transporter periplasmic adaptor subunit [Paramuribaculum sp.]MDE7237383.1 efflux RND transporter periplasmic adaptor subunit [Paramuribaculum sp.]
MKSLTYITMVLGVSALMGCHNHDSDSHNCEGETHVYDGEQHNDECENHRHEVENHRYDGDTRAHDHEGEARENTDEIVFEQAKAAAAGVVSDTVTPAPFSTVIHTSGKVLPALGDEATVAATVAGVIKLSRSMAEGEKIGRGAAVATVSTRNLAEGDVGSRARIAYEQAKAEYDRASSLVDDRIISQSDYRAAQAEYERAKLAYEAVGRSGGSGVAVVSPAAGYVKQLMVKDGDYVEVGQPVMTVTQNRRLFLRAEVAERDYEALRQVSSARFRTAYSAQHTYDLADMGGRLVSYGRSGGASSAFIPVTFEFDNTGSVLPDSYADIYLIGAPRRDVISVPETALIEEQGIYFVYVHPDENCYQKREVKIGASDGKRVEILAGLAPGEVVVTQGAVRVKLAGAGNSIPGHTHNH